MEKEEIMERIYDTIMKNTDNPQFETEKVEHQSLDCDNKKIYFVLEGVEFVLKINKTGNGVV